MSCENGHTEVAKLLILYGATDLDGGLEHACRYAQIDTIKFLLSEEGCSDFDTALVVAAQYNHVHIAKLLIEHGAVNLDQAFLCACDYNSLAVVEWLSQQVEDKTEGLNTACVHGAVAVVKYLLAQRVAVTEETFVLACGGCLEVVEILLSSLGQVSVQGLNNGLFQAATHGCTEIVRKLRALGATAWNQALFSACEGTLNVETLVVLISFGATEMKKVPNYLVPVLLNRGVNPILFEQRATPLLRAREERQVVTRTALLEFSNLSEDCLDNLLLDYLNY